MNRIKIISYFEWIAGIISAGEYVYDRNTIYGVRDEGIIEYYKDGERLIRRGDYLFSQNGIMILKVKE